LVIFSQPKATLIINAMMGCEHCQALLMMGPVG
jgi:hypothetical protein